MAAQITMSLDEYEQLKIARVTAENDAAAARAQLLDTRLSNVERLEIAWLARHLLAVARFAVSNLPPEMIKGWPYEHLKNAAELLRALPDYSADDTSLAIELRNFADEIAQFERARARQPLPELPVH